MLERVALNQTRLNVPGVAPDSRGVMLGQRGLVLLPTVERLVSFFRVYGDQDSIDELLPTLRINQVKTRLGSREFVVSYGIGSSYQMDRCAGITKMLGGLAFTGTSRHFVKYRDAASPLGYDTDRLLPTGGDLALYHDDFSQAYDEERDIPFRQLVLQLTLRRIPRTAEGLPREAIIAVRPGLSRAVQGYLYRNGVPTGVALAEGATTSSFDEGPRHTYLYRTSDLPERIAELMTATPGVELFVPVGPNVATEYGYRHPIHLPSCLSIFATGGLHLFCGSRDTVDVVDPVPVFSDIRNLTRINVDFEKNPRPHATREASISTIKVPLRLVPTNEPWRRIRGVSIQWERSEWLQHLVYMLPPELLRDTRIHVSKERIVLLGEIGVEAIPLGTLLCNVGDSLLVAAGYGFLPHVNSELLADLVGLEPGELCVFEPSVAQPYILRDTDFQALGRGAVASMLARREPGILAPEHTHDPVRIRYDQLGPFPLWGLPGRSKRGDTP